MLLRDCFRITIMAFHHGLFLKLLGEEKHARACASLGTTDTTALLRVIGAVEELKPKEPTAKECKICCDTKPLGAFSCGHIFCCVECGRKVKKCPICRAQVSIMELFEC